MLIKAKQLREKRAKLVEDARAIMDKADLGADDEARFDELMAEADKLKAEIDRLERLADAEHDLSERVYQRAGREDITTGEAQRDMEVENEVFNAWLAGGMSMLSDEQRQIMGRFQANSNDLRRIQNAQSTGANTGGGYLVPDDFRALLEKVMKEFGGMRSVATILPTATGGTLLMPTTDDTSNKGAILGENTQVSEQDVTFGQVSLDAYMYTSKLVRVSLQLLQDSAINLQSLLASLLGERIARIVNEHCTIGTGTDQPDGIVTASTLGKTGAAGQVDSVTTDDLVDLEHSIDPAYRRGAKWMFADSTLKVLKKLKDADGRFLWLPGLATREPDTILSYPFTVNQDVPAMAAGAKSILFGALHKYIIRDVLGIHMMRLNERYADYLQVGFMAFSRHDGELLDAGAHPVKHYANAAS